MHCLPFFWKRRLLPMGGRQKTSAAKVLQGLSLAEKRALLARLLEEQSERSASVVPLSHGQRGLWFLHQLDPQSAAYNLCYPSRFRSRLNLPALTRALQRLFDRHASLRTTFEERGGVLCQRVHQRPSLPLEVIDAASWSEAALRERLAALAQRPFDLERGPLVRMYIFRRAHDDHIFLLCAHHIVGDFWSLVVVMAEMQALYPAECDGRPAPLEPIKRQYGDFVRWQAEMLEGPEGQRLAQYWERHLAGVPVVLDLPADRPRPPVFSRRGGTVTWRLEPAMIGRLRALALSEGTTLYALLLAAFELQLFRYTGQEEFLVGCPFAGRSRSGFDDVIGYFINMLPLRADLAGDPSFRALLRRVRGTVLLALQHQDYPFTLLVEQAKLKPDPSRAPLVQVSFTQEKVHGTHDLKAWRFLLPQTGAELSLGGLSIEPYYIEQCSSQCDLEMVFEEGNGSVEGMLRYSADLFDATTAQRMVGHFLTMLEGIADYPERKISAIPWLTRTERRLVLGGWNVTKADFPQGLCLHQLFEGQAKATPHAIAVCGGGTRLSYGELDRWSNQVARRLRRLGAGPGLPVALFFERSPEMIAAMLGVLKAGSAYVPLDPAAPQSRLKMIVADTQPRLIVTQQSLCGRLASLDRTVLSLDDRGCEINGDQTEASSESGVSSHDLAYIMYTSGSTGRPKGVMVEHRAICNTIHWRQKDLPVHGDDAVLHNLNYVFDPSLALIFHTLASGGRIVLAEPGEEYDPHRLLERAILEGVTVIEAPPVMLRVMLDDPLLKACRTLRWVCCGGEAMPPDLPPRLFELLDVALYNMYGPTETAVDATWWACRRGDDRPCVPIGRPIANVQAYILDPHGQPVAVGVPGELHIGGAGLARGYWNAPELTAERFMADPFSDAPGARLYRTGDRARWLDDGVIAFLGRLDHQVKVRGHRIELGEVESALASHPALREAAVAVEAGAAGGSRLVAYVVGHGDGEPLATEPLRRYLKDRLPEYMVPSVFLSLAALPRTPSGKIDREALPAPPRERAVSSRPFVAPATALEEFLAGLWRELLQVERVGTLDNFFELGGNSIGGAVLINRLQQKIGHHVSVIALFDSPTVAGLAHYLSEACPEVVQRVFGAGSHGGDRGFDGVSRANGDGARHRPGPKELVVALQPEGSETPWFMIHPPGGIVVCYQALAQRLSRERPFYGIRARGLHGEADLPERLEDMAAEYVAAVREIEPHGPYLLGGWSAGGLVAFEMAHQLLAQGQRTLLLALLDTVPENAEDQNWADRPGVEYGLELSLEQLSRLGPDEQLPYLWQHAMTLGLIESSIPMSVVHQVLDDLKQVFHHHMVLTDRYVVRRYPGTITLFRPTDAPVAAAVRHDRGWGSLAASVDVHFVPGQHHSMVQEPHVQELARALESCLQTSQDRVAPETAHTFLSDPATGV
jgi:amino acid adenylation domain-containing protein